MRIGITDSGVGGLSVCAEVEARLRSVPVREDLEILYINAALRDDYSYNAMASRQDKLETFDRFLANASERYRPDMLYIACNSLSVLFQDRYFDHHRQIPIEGIVDTGTQAILSALRADDDAAVIVFATPTTVNEETYRQNLLAAGVPEERIVQQACPDLPDAISNDFTGREATRLLQEFVPAALRQFPEKPDSVVAFLGCTHYGYQAGVFERLLGEAVSNVLVLNPNRSAAGSILEQLHGGNEPAAPQIRFITPYEIPARPMRSLPHYLGAKAPLTVAALRYFEHDPDLYRP